MCVSKQGCVFYRCVFLVVTRISFYQGCVFFTRISAWMDFDVRFQRCVFLFYKDFGFCKDVCDKDFGLDGFRCVFSKMCVRVFGFSRMCV